MNLVHALLLMQPSPGSNPMYGFAFQIVLILAIFYFILFRPQQKQRKQQERSLREIKKGDEIVTAGGIIGEVIHIKETMKDGARGRDDGGPRHDQERRVAARHRARADREGAVEDR